MEQRACKLEKSLASIFLILVAGRLMAQTVVIRDTIPAAVLTEQGIHAGMNSCPITPETMPAMASATGETDFVKYIQTFPGIAAGADGGSAYYVRGGNYGSNLQTLDGVPIFGSAHLLGFASSYPMEIISSADFQVGGFSSEEGNFSSSHIRMISRDGSFKTMSAKASASNFLLGGYLNTPLVRDKLSLSASLRVSPLQYEYTALSGLIDKSFNFNLVKAAVYDAYAKIKYRFNGRRQLSFSVFNTLDSYRYNLNDASEDSMNWSNLIALMKYDAMLGRRTAFSATASFNHFNNSQGMMKRMEQTDNNLLLRSSVDEATLQGTVGTRAKHFLQFQYGLKGRFSRFNPGSARVLKTDGIFFKSSSPLLDHVTDSFIGTVHGQAELGDLSKGFLRLAARLNYSSVDRFTPEMSVLGSWAVLKHVGIEVSFDRLAQYYHTLEGVPLGWSLDMLVPTSASLRPEKTMQVSTGIFSDWGKHHVSVCAYYKELENLVWYSDADKLFDSALAGWEKNIDIGSGTSKGIEIQYKKGGEVLTYALACTLSKTDRVFSGLNSGLPFPAKFDRRYIVNAAISAHVVSTEKVDLSLGTLITCQSGHRETVPAGSWHDDIFIAGPVEIDFYTGFNNYQMPPYVRCDINARMELKGRWFPQEISMGVYNVLNRHNPSWLSYDSQTKEWKRISLLPAMPGLKYVIRF